MTLWDLALRARADPLIGYALLGAGVLLAASLIGGAVRGDVRALLRPSSWIASAAALLAALALTAAGERLDVAFGLDGNFASLRRLPLHLLAIGYGPSLGMLTGLAFAVVESREVALPGAGAVLVVELAAIGWLALGPSPRRYRLAAPLSVVLGWALASATLQLAFWAAEGRPSAVTDFLSTQTGVAYGVVFSALVVTLPTAAWWRTAAPGAAPKVRLEPAEDRTRWLRPLKPPSRGRRAARKSMRGHPRRPRPLERPARPRRRLDQPPTPAPLHKADKSEVRVDAPEP